MWRFPLILIFNLIRFLWPDIMFLIIINFNIWLIPLENGILLLLIQLHLLLLNVVHFVFQVVKLTVIWHAF